MKNLVTQFVSEVAQDPKVGATVAGWTLGSGIATIFDWVGNNSGNIAILIGAVLSLVLIYTNVTQHRLKIKIMNHDLEERESRKGRRDRRDDLDIIDN